MIPALRRLRQGDGLFQARLGYMVIPCLKKTHINNTCAIKNCNEEEEEEEEGGGGRKRGGGDLANRIASCSNLCQFPLI